MLKIFSLTLAICLLSLFAEAQNGNNPDTKMTASSVEEESLRKGALHAIALAKKQVQENTAAYEENEQQGIISFLNKTIEELEERAEKQYQNNRYIILKEEE